MTILLVGLPGSGKTTIARHLARMAGWQAADTDQLIEQRTRQSVASLFAEYGEAHFRQIEHEVVLECAQMPRTIVATGGGAILRADNRAAMRAAGNCVIYIHHPADALARRHMNDRHRPLLSGVEGQERLQRYRELYRLRDPLYREVATYIHDAGRQGAIPRAVRMVAMQLELGGVLSFAPPQPQG